MSEFKIPAIGAEKCLVTLPMFFYLKARYDSSLSVKDAKIQQVINLCLTQNEELQSTPRLQTGKSVFIKLFFNP